MGGAIASKKPLFNKYFTVTPYLSPPIFRVFCPPKLTYLSVQTVRPTVRPTLKNVISSHEKREPQSPLQMVEYADVLQRPQNTLLTAF